MGTVQKQVDEATRALKSLQFFADHYASTEKMHSLGMDIVTVLRGGGPLSNNVATAIEAFLSGKSVVIADHAEGNQPPRPQANRAISSTGG